MRPSIGWLGLLACVAGTASAQQRAPSPGNAADTLHLTRAQAVATALLSNPQVTIAREQYLQVRAQRVSGIAIPDPVLSTEYDSLPGPFRLSPSASRPLSLGLTIPFPDKFRLQNTIGVANIQSSEAQLRLTQQLVATQAAQAYDSMMVSRMHQRDLLEARDLAADFLKKTEARFNAGTVARLDVIKAQVSLSQAENALIASARNITNADAAMNRILGRPLGAPLAPAESLAVPGALPDLDALLAAALRSRQELKDLEAQQRAARANSQLTREQAILPDLFLSANRDIGVSAPMWYNIGIAMPLPVLFWQHTRGDFAQAQHREAELAATYRDARAAVGQDVREAYANADAALRQAVYIRDQLLPSAREAYHVATVSYGLGGLSALDVLDARSSLLDAESQYADALAAANSARADLERAVGVPLNTFAPATAPGAPRE